ncbi:PEP-CTERM sorting domain-containing protein [Marinobacter sp. 1Y8]
MHSLLQSASLALLVLIPYTANATVMSLSGDGEYAASVDTDNAWLEENTFSEGVDFWTFEVTTPTTLSIDIASAIDFGISVYAGEIMDEFQAIFFSNSGDFSDGSLTYVAGTPAIPMPGSSLDNIMLATSGFFTIAVGGDNGFGMDGPHDYTMTVAGLSSHEVPEPASFALLLAGGLALVARRRTNRSV